jgi:calcium-translocating P-type ATPase
VTANHGTQASRGLSATEARERLSRYGPNVLPTSGAPPAWRQLAGQLTHFFALLLWAAGMLAIAGGLPELGAAIFGVVVLNGVFAFAQEHRAENAAARLRELVPRVATVVRDGCHLDIDAAELVPGDVVVVGGGDRVSADQRVLDGHGLLVDESILTGESVPAAFEKGGLLRAGTFVIQGEGTAEVEATGPSTALGEVAALTRTVHRPATPLAKELHRLVRTIATIAVSIGVAFFGVVLLLDTPPSDGFVFAVGVTVALVPEALLPTVTLSLAVGAQRMAGRNALVRRLEAVETLGSTTFICTDKTGTLTQNQMNVTDVWTPVGTAKLDGAGYAPEAKMTADDRTRLAVTELAIVARRCSVGHAVWRDGEWVAQGDPMDAAIDALVRRLGAPVEAAVADEPDLARNAFDPRRRLMSVVTAGRVLVKGAPDAVFDRCGTLPSSAPGALAALSGRGLRVLAVASRPVRRELPPDASSAERDLTLLGLVGIVDPPRPAARDAIAACRAAGIRIAMVTGDHPATAAAIAEEVGLLLAASPLLTGVDLPDDEQLLADAVDHDGAVISRVTPEDKLRIARALQARGHVVAMTGDGVNDGPALQEADIGVAMGRSGTDVAREAADLVLLDDDFATIIEAVRQGRATFHNARQFLTYHLTDNVAELTPFLLWAVSGGRFPLALGVLQILALDLGTDTLSAAALGAEPPPDHILDGPPASGRLLNRRVALRSFGVLGPVEAALGIVAFLVALGAAGWRPGDAFPTGSGLAAASGATFATVVLAQTANAFACRSASQPAWRAGITGNPHLIVAVVVELAFAFGVLLTPAVARLLGHEPPPMAGWLVAVASMPVIVVVDAAAKARHRHRLEAG